MIPWIDASNPVFPPPELALLEPDGLLCAGGNLEVQTLVKAYGHGIFPWYSDGQPILWWSPDPRMVLTPEKFHLTRRMKRFIRTTQLTVTVDIAFEQVITECSRIPRNDQDGTWITDDMIHAYCALNNAGFAHSIEVWDEAELVGGLYGVALGKVFFGESMFSKASNASKLALAALVLNGQFKLIDCQQHTSHLESQGAELLSRPAFLERIEKLADNNPVPLHISREKSSWMGRASA